MHAYCYEHAQRASEAKQGESQSFPEDKHAARHAWKKIYCFALKIKVHAINRYLHPEAASSRPTCFIPKLKFGWGRNMRKLAPDMQPRNKAFN